jgi:hypothetical protein
LLHGVDSVQSVAPVIIWYEIQVGMQVHVHAQEQGTAPEQMTEYLSCVTSFTSTIEADERARELPATSPASSSLRSASSIRTFGGDHWVAVAVAVTVKC